MLPIVLGHLKTNIRVQFPVEWGTPPLVVEEAGSGLFSILYSAVGDNLYRESWWSVQSILLDRNTLT